MPNARIAVDRILAHAAGWDAGNRNMRRNGRTAWNEDDWDAACDEFARLYPEDNETKGEGR